jgi:hypothetical protein
MLTVTVGPYLLICTEAGQHYVTRYGRTVGKFTESGLFTAAGDELPSPTELYLLEDVLQSAIRWLQAASGATRMALS